MGQEARLAEGMVEVMREVAVALVEVGELATMQLAAGPDLLPAELTPGNDYGAVAIIGLSNARETPEVALNTSSNNVYDLDKWRGRSPPIDRLGA